MLTSAKEVVTSMTKDAIYEERESDWSHEVSAVGTLDGCRVTRPFLSAKGEACETIDIYATSNNSALLDARAVSAKFKAFSFPAIKSYSVVPYSVLPLFRVFQYSVRGSAKPHLN